MNFIDVYGGYVYVATGKNGLLKVGFTGNVLNRIAGLESAFEKRNDTIHCMHASGLLSNARSIESELIGFCSRRYTRLSHRGREWYVNTEVDVVLEFARRAVGELRPIDVTHPWQVGGRRWRKATVIANAIKTTKRKCFVKPAASLKFPDLPAPEKKEVGHA